MILDGVTIAPIRNLCGSAEFCETFLDVALTKIQLNLLAERALGLPKDGE